MIKSDSDREMRRVPEYKEEDLEKTGGERGMCVRRREGRMLEDREQVMSEQGLCSRDDLKESNAAMLTLSLYKQHKSSSHAKLH